MQTNAHEWNDMLTYCVECVRMVQVTALFNKMGGPVATTNKLAKLQWAMAKLAETDEDE